MLRRGIGCNGDIRELSIIFGKKKCIFGNIFIELFLKPAFNTDNTF